jgi:hypothetical protein
MLLYHRLARSTVAYSVADRIAQEMIRQLITVTRALVSSSVSLSIRHISIIGTRRSIDIAIAYESVRIVTAFGIIAKCRHAQGW